MKREEFYDSCLEAISRSNSLLVEASTGFGKSKIALDLVNHLCNTVYKGKKTKMLLLVAKTVHKQTWKDEISKWGGVNADITMECYESLHKHTGEFFEFVVMDECHHIASEARMEALKTIKYGYMLGLSATIPRNVKAFFKYNYHSQVVSCDIIEAIDSEVLPEPTILLFPLQVENNRVSEILELHVKAPGPVVNCEYKDLYKYKFKNIHVKCKCTQAQKLRELDALIDWFKKKAMSGNQAMKQTWLYFCGKRLEFLADCKLQWVKLILHHLDKERTITFCKTISQTEQLGKNCIHSQNKDAAKIYEKFNTGKIDHITAVNILNENANLVNCRYGIFCNITSSDIITQQRQGRLLRHKDPVMVIPYYKGTREEELVIKAIEGFSKVKTIHSINEI
jgi:superfamily II DNA or RNA helicase